jgi:hypothetical protein
VTWSAKWAADRLSTNHSRLADSYPRFNELHHLQATAASYTIGLGKISGTPSTID